MKFSLKIKVRTYFPLFQLPITYIEHQVIKHTLHLLKTVSNLWMVYVDFKLDKTTAFAQFILHKQSTLEDELP